MATVDTEGSSLYWRIQSASWLAWSAGSRHSWYYYYY